MEFQSIIQSMSFVDYCIAFGTLRIEDKDTGAFGYKQWEFWDGWLGEPGQLDVGEMLERSQVFWTPKARQKGISEIWSLYAKYILEKEPGAAAKVFSAGTAQAREFLEERFARKVEGALTVYPNVPFPEWDIGKDRATCSNGSYIQIYSSDNVGGRGGSQRLTLLDEGREYIDRDFREMLASIFPSLRTRNQLAIVSSGKVGSTFNKRVDGLRKSLPVLRSSVWGSPDARTNTRFNYKTGMIFLNDLLDPDNRSPEWRQNTLEERFGGDIVRFKAEHPETINDIFTSHEGRVIASLDEARHRRIQPWEWVGGDENYIIFDHGNTEAHPSVIAFIRYNRYTGKAHCYDHVFTRATSLPITGPKARDKIDYYRRLGAPEPLGIADGSVFNDYGTGAKTVGAEMEAYTGISFIKAFKTNKEGRVEVLIRAFFNDLMTIDPKCVDGWVQLENWMWDTKKDEASQAEDDFPDTLQYFWAYVNKSGPPSPPKTNLEKAFERMDRGRITGEDDEPAPIDFDRLGYGALEPRYGMGETVYGGD